MQMLVDASIVPVGQCRSSCKHRHPTCNKLTTTHTRFGFHLRNIEPRLIHQTTPPLRSRQNRTLHSSTVGAPCNHSHLHTWVCTRFHPIRNTKPTMDTHLLVLHSTRVM